MNWDSGLEIRGLCHSDGNIQPSALLDDLLEFSCVNLLHWVKIEGSVHKPGMHQLAGRDRLFE
jgi:hypothetical protein